MLQQGFEEKRATNISRWKAERGGILRGCGPSLAGRSFDEDLALFERQVREEAGRLAGRVPPAALSA